MGIWKGGVVRGPSVETSRIAAIAFGTSVSLYRGQFLHSATQRIGKELQRSSRPPDAVAVSTEMEQFMRVRDYALRTLRSCLGWAPIFASLRGLSSLRNGPLPLMVPSPFPNHTRRSQHLAVPTYSQVGRCPPPLPGSDWSQATPFRGR